MKHLSVAVLVLLTLWCGMFDIAFALECDGKIVSIGYHTWRVREICGEPFNVRDIRQLVPRRYYDAQRQIHVETFIPIDQSVWTYNFGSNRLIYILTFENDKLVNIETEGYGR